MKTPEEARAHWADELESGRFEQTQGVLRRDDTYCCLGVACELAREDGVEVKPDALRLDGGVYLYDEEDVALPYSVQEWLGLDGDCGLYRGDSPYTDDNLAADNDHGQTFSEIARTIRSGRLLLAP